MVFWGCVLGGGAYTAPGMWALSSPAKDVTGAAAQEVQSLIHWTARESPSQHSVNWNIARRPVEHFFCPSYQAGFGGLLHALIHSAWPYEGFLNDSHS